MWDSAEQLLLPYGSHNSRIKYKCNAIVELKRDAPESNITSSTNKYGNVMRRKRTKPQFHLYVCCEAVVQSRTFGMIERRFHKFLITINDRWCV